MKSLANKSNLVILTVCLVVLSALVNIWSAVTPSLPQRLDLIRDIFSIELREFSRLTAVMTSFIMLLLSRGLFSLKRNAWRLTLAALVLSMIAHIIKGLDFEEVAFDALIVALLLITRKEYIAKADMPSVKQGLRVLGLAFVFTMLYGTIGFFLLNNQFTTELTLPASLVETGKMFLLTPAPVAETRLAKWFLNSIYFIASSSFIIALVSLLRPVMLRHSPDTDTWTKATTIVEKYGKSGLARFTILGDKQFYFEGDDSLVSFKPISGIGLALGDPIGPDEDIPKAIQGFKHYCKENAWKAAFYQTLPETQQHYKDAGFTVLPIGQEAVVDLKTFNTQGKSNKNLRNAINKFAKIGYSANFYAAPQSLERLVALKAVSDAWLVDKHGSEKDFSLGSFTNEYIGSCDVMTVEDSNGAIVAFANFVTEYQKNELTFDLMRYNDAAPDDTMTFLFLQMITHAQKEGFDSFNLGLVALAGLAESPTAIRAEKMLHYVYENLNQFYSFQGLHEFKSKFNPNWETRYLVYPNKSDLLQVLEAIALADSSSGLWGEIRKEVEKRLKARAEQKEFATAKTINDAEVKASTIEPPISK